MTATSSRFTGRKTTTPASVLAGLERAVGRAISQSYDMSPADADRFTDTFLGIVKLQEIVDQWKKRTGA